MPGSPFATPVTLDELWKNILVDLGAQFPQGVVGNPLEMKTILSELDTGLASLSQQATAGGAATALGPTGSLATTIPRLVVNTGGLTNTSGTMQAVLIYLPANLKISNFNLMLGNTGDAGPTGVWQGLASAVAVTNVCAARQVLAVSANSTAAVSANSPYTPQPVASTYNFAASSIVAATSFTTTYAGLYYYFFNWTTANSPTFLGTNQNNVNTNGLAPILFGTSNTGGTATPVAAGSTLTALTASASVPFAWFT